MKNDWKAVAGLCSTLLMFSLTFPLKGAAEVNVSVTVPLPGLVIPAPPALVVIPGTYAYYPPEVSVDLFFYHGYWYRPYGGHWYISAGYNGPWRGVAFQRVPGALRRLPPSYRHVPPGYRPMPYREVRSNWRTWERDRYWDRPHEGRGERGEQGHGHGRGGMMGRRGDD
jgi:hypothetical protein